MGFHENDDVKLGPALPPNVIRQQWHIEAQRKPLCCAQKHNAEECMDEVLRKDKLQRKTHKSDNSVSTFRL